MGKISTKGHKNRPGERDYAEGPICTGMTMQIPDLSYTEVLLQGKFLFVSLLPIQGI